MVKKNAFEIALCVYVRVHTHAGILHTLVVLGTHHRGYVWEPDRNNDEEGKEFITFIAQVEGLSAVPDGRIYMNAFIDTVKGRKDKGECNIIQKENLYIIYRVDASDFFAPRL